jgi:hypothetical protein
MDLNAKLPSSSLDSKQNRRMGMLPAILAIGVTGAPGHGGLRGERENEEEHAGVPKEGSPTAAREGAGGILAGGGAQGGRLGFNTAAAFRRSPDRGKRLRRRIWTTRSRRWRRLALGGGDRDESTSAGHRPVKVHLVP